MGAVQSLTTGGQAETPLFFRSGPVELYGVLHEPAAPACQPAFVFCHPFGEEKLWAHRVFVAFARELTRRGHAVLRFDYRGNGDSEGEFSDTTLETNLDDIAAAVAFLKARRKVESVGLMGLRLGATQAALAADGRDDVSSLILWSPVTDGGRYMQELLRINLATQMATHGAITADREALVEQMRTGQTVNVDGYEVTLPFFEQVSSVNLATSPRSFAGPCVLVQIERSRASAPSKDLIDLQQKYRNASLQFVEEEPFWKEIHRFYEVADRLFADTLSWLDQLSPRNAS